MSGGVRIDVLKVEGFGHFSHFELALKPGLNLLYGPNEAGKSTLLAFIRSMLFGFEKRSRPEQRYEPEEGTYGGELCLSTGLGPLVVRRRVDRRGKGVLTVGSAEGEELQPARLEEALASVSRELFCEVFAFSLDELSTFEKLAEEGGVSRALFAAGLQGARRLPELEKALEKRAGELFAPRGQKPVLNQVLKELEEVKGKLRALEDRPAKYFEERERLESLGRQQEETKALQEQLTRELGRLSRLEAALGDLGELVRPRAELATLPELSTFPSNGALRLEELLQRLKEARAAQARGEALLASTEAEVVRLSSTSAVREHEEALRTALAAFTPRAELLRTLPGRRAGFELKRRHAEQALVGLGLEVDAAGLLTLELGAAARGTLELLADRLTRAEAERREAEVALGQARAEQERHETALARLETERARLPPAPAAQVRRRQTALGRLQLLRVEREQASTQRTEQKQRLESLRAQAETPPGAAPALWPLVAGLVGAGVLALLLGLYAGVAVGVLALVGAVLLVGPLALAWRRAVAGHQQAVEAHASRQRLHAQEVARVQSALDVLTGRLTRLHQELGALAAEVGVPAEAPASELAAWDASLAEALRQAERWEHLGREWEARAAERDTVAREALAAQEAEQQAQARVGALRAELSSLLATRRFPSDLSPQRALELWRDAATLRQRLMDLLADEESLATDEATCGAVVDRLRAVAEAVGLGQGPVETVASRVATALEELKERSTELRGARTRRDELVAEQARLTRLCEAEERALAALLAQGGCGDEESFRQRAHQAKRFAELTLLVRERGQRVEAATGLEEVAAREALHAVGGEEQLKERLGQLRMQQPAYAERLKALHTDYGATRSQLERWEGDEELATLRIQEERLRARAAELATRYATDKLALALLARARQRFEEEQQPRVIQLASEHFSQLTGGRYRRVFVPAAGKRELRVSDARKDWSAEQLSRGTREQLYLAFRLAVIQDFGETRGALPLVVDDILVNFDLERTRLTLKQLSQLAGQHQVIAFTCHPWLRELFEAEGARVVELSRERSGHATAA